MSAPTTTATAGGVFEAPAEVLPPGMRKLVWRDSRGFACELLAREDVADVLATMLERLHVGAGAAPDARRNGPALTVVHGSERPRASRRTAPRLTLTRGGAA